MKDSAVDFLAAVCVLLGIGFAMGLWCIFCIGVVTLALRLVGLDF